MPKRHPYQDYADQINSILRAAREQLSHQDVDRVRTAVEQRYHDGPSAVFEGTLAWAFAGRLIKQLTDASGELTADHVRGLEGLIADGLPTWPPSERQEPDA